MQILKSWIDSLRLIFSRENNKTFFGQSFDGALSIISKLVFQCPWPAKMIFIVVFSVGILIIITDADLMVLMYSMVVLPILLVYIMTMLAGIDSFFRDKIQSTADLERYMEQYGRNYFFYSAVFLLCNIPLFFCIVTVLFWIIMMLAGTPASQPLPQGALPVFAIMGCFLVLQALYTQVYILGSFFLPRDVGIIASIKKGVVFAFKNIPALFLLAICGVLTSFLVYFGISKAMGIPLTILSYFVSNPALMIADSFVLSLFAHAVHVLSVLLVCTVVFSFFIATSLTLFKRRELRGEI